MCVRQLANLSTFGLIPGLGSPQPRGTGASVQTPVDESALRAEEEERRRALRRRGFSSTILTGGPAQTLGAPATAPAGPGAGMKRLFGE